MAYEIRYSDGEPVHGGGDNRFENVEEAENQIQELLSDPDWKQGNYEIFEI